MRILHLTSLFNPDRVGGAELLVERLALEQRRLGYEVGVATSSREVAGPEVMDGVSVFRMGYVTPFFILDWAQQSRIRRILYKGVAQMGAAMNRRLRGVLEAFAPDIVNTHSLSELSPSLWGEVARHDIPVVHTLHDYASICARGSMFRDGKACPGQHGRCVAHSALHRMQQGAVDAVVGVGHEVLDRHVRARMFEHVPERLKRVIWNPLDAPRTDSARPSGGAEVVFGMLGRVEAAKGVDLLLAAARMLPKGGWRVLVGGSAVDGLDAYREAARGLPVEFLGYMPADAFYDRIDCLIAPPIWPEPFGRTVSEAYQRGIPVIGSAVAGIAEQIGRENRDWLFGPADVAGLAERVMRVLVDPTLLSRPIANRDVVAAGVSPPRVAEEYLSLYRDVLAGRAMRRGKV